MIKRILSSRLPLIVYNPVKVFSIDFFTEAFNAGSLPVFDTEFTADNEIIENVKKIAKKNILFGLRLACPDKELIERLKEFELANLDLLVIPVEKNNNDDISFIKSFADTKIALEIIDININEKIDQVAPHALILKGNEAGGRVSRNSSFILMQWYLKNTDYPVFIHGGIGRHTAAGMFAAGVSGVVLDSQLWLSNESPVSDNFKKLLSGLDESDSIEIATDGDTIFRVFAKLGTKIAKELKEEAILLSGRNNAKGIIYEKIKENIVSIDNGEAQAVQSLFFLGQDGFFAKNFAKKSTALKEMIYSFFTNIGAMLNFVDRFDPVRKGTPLAKDHGTDFPLIQGPMANISDNSEFALDVLKAGALPFFAVGSLPEKLAGDMLKKASRDVPVFGAGLVGIEAFNPAVESHLEMVKKYKIPFALFAGGVPSQVLKLEKAGTKTYLHTPSISMMKNAIKSGCTRFIFEGKEAGGHIGSLSSLVLWEAAISHLLDNEQDLLNQNNDPKDADNGQKTAGNNYHSENNGKKLAGISLVFAGGISTCFASCFISGISSVLAAKGVKIGLQVGSAYLFSREIVDSKSVKKQYQEILSSEDETVVIGSSVGLASRTAPTDFARMMLEMEKEMIKKGESLETRKRSFEKKNIGSLLIGAKGFLPDFKHTGPENYRYFDGEEHREKGNFLVGESLAFFDSPLSIKDIHNKYFNAKDLLFDNINNLEVFSSDKSQVNDEIAIIGMGCILPGADNPEKLWQNIIDKKYAIKEMPETRFRRDFYYSPDKNAEDRSYSSLAGIIDDFTFNREKFGYDEAKAAKLSRSQQMLLEAAYQAVENSGYLGDDQKLTCKDPTRTAVIIASCLGNELGNELLMKYHFPEITAMLKKTDEFNKLSDTKKDNLIEALKQGLEGKNKGYDPVHGIILNIEASRIAKHLGIRGENYIVDAACASSFTAIDAACKELLSGDYDQVIAGGVNTHLVPESFIGFSKMGALSAKGSFPFDEKASGFILGEGTAVFVLKRMKDAIRDDDSILAVIKGIGASSDGRGKAIAAPNPDGQILAIERCFENIKSDIKPSDIKYIEAHGTATPTGDQAEIATLKQVYTSEKTGISSIKSQIGHLLGSAGAAGLIKAVLAVNKGVLPPNGNFEKLSPALGLENSPLYIIKDAKKWEENDNQTRKASVSAYGFGGINYHLVVEEFNKNFYIPYQRTIFSDPDYDFNDDRIVMAGLGVFLPGAANCDEFWEKLQSGEKQLSAIPEENFTNKAYADFDEKSFYRLPMIKAGVIKDYKFNNIKYRMPPTTVRSIERGQLFGLEAAEDAIKGSGLDKLIEKGNKIGVILGTISGDRQSKNILRIRKLLVGEIIKNADSIKEEKRKIIADQIVDAIRKRLPENNEDTTPGLLSNIIAGRIANYFGLNGASYVLDASCASSFIAIKNAAKSIASKDLDFVLAGGVDANLYPAVLMAFKRIGLLSESDCHYFDSRADGYVMGEGAAIHVLTTYKKAKQAGMKILGEINSFAIKSSVPDHLLSPSEQTFVSTINACYKKSAIRKQEIRHLDLFAFSNILGDMIEKQVVEKCFSHELSCGNVKPQFGYFKAANPAVAMAKLVLMEKNRKILPDFNYDEKYSTIKDSCVLKPGKKIKSISDNNPLRFAFNVNGIGGNHCHMIISTLPAFLMKERNINIASAEFDSVIDIPVHGSAVHGTTVPGKAAATGTAASQVAAGTSKLQNLNIRHFSYSADKKGEKQKMIVLLSGQGSQRSGMMQELFNLDPEIRNVMERGEEIFVETRGYSLLDMMFNDNKDINLTENTQPAVFLSSAALFDRLYARGFSPDLFIGHSVGEYTALFCSGMLNFDDAMRLVIKRADLMKAAAEKYPGRIMVVFKNEKETSSFIRESKISGIYITNKNSENQTAVSGSSSAIESFCSYLSKNNVIYRKLNLSGAFHTPLFAEAAEKLRDYLDTITFNETFFGHVISNVTARPYPEDRKAVKDLLAKQITSPVEFIRSIEYVYEAGRTHYIEVGPSRLLTNLLKNINIADYKTCVTVDVKKGEIKSFEECKLYLKSFSSLFTRTMEHRKTILPEKKKPVLPGTGFQQALTPATMLDEDFSSFKARNQDLKDRLLYEEYRRRRREAAMEVVERFNFCAEKIVISGVSLGLPGKTKRVFAKDNFDKIIDGNNFIEPLSLEDQERITDKNITRLFKQPDGNARFVEITRPEDVIQLAGQLGYFDLTDEYGIKTQYDISMALAVAAGIEALKDAGIPLVMQYKKASTDGRMIPDGFALPKEMQDDTGVIVTSLFPNCETIVNEMEKYLYDRFFLKPYEELENIYYYLMENVKDVKVKENVTEWFFKIKGKKRNDLGEYKFERNFIANACPLGAAFLAQLIRAKGPNTLISSACASTTQAIGIAEDWIRVGRCKRVIVVGGENATSHAQNQWIGSGFLALGAATVKKRVSEAAKPFDADRNGTILGSGAVGLVIEKASMAGARGMRGQAEILGTHMANSAYHTFNIDVNHLASEMKKFIEKVEKQHNLKKQDYANKLLFMSHETYTPARGGSADAEVTALKTTFSHFLKDICISNTKGFTGHTLGAAIEDVVMIKALQKRKAPPIANLKKIPVHFRELNFSSKKKINSEYGLHLAAGFGSHLAFLFVRRIEENAFNNNKEYMKWVERISGTINPQLKIIDNTLCVIPGEKRPAQKNMIENKLPAKDLSALKIQQSSSMPPAPAGLTASSEVATDANTAMVPDTAVSTSAGGAPAPGATISSAAVTSGSKEKIKEIIAEQTGYTTDMLEDNLDLEADLGIDTVKQVEIFAKAASYFNFPVPEDLKLRELNTIAKLAAYVASRTGGRAEGYAASPAPVSAAASDSSSDPDVTVPDAPSSAAASELTVTGGAGEKIKEIIAEQTGYTTDMLEDNLDLEADLGIDTVKQVEIFAKAASYFNFSVPEDLKLRELNTIAKLAAYVVSKTEGAAEGSAAAPADVSQSDSAIDSAETSAATRISDKISDTITPSAAAAASDLTDAPLSDTAELSVNKGTGEKIKEIIAEQTGYTTDMLDDNIDLEADLGIDTVKQVEIFAKAAAFFNFPVPEDLKLRELNTIAKLAAYFDSLSGPGDDTTPEKGKDSHRGTMDKTLKKSTTLSVSGTGIDSGENQNVKTNGQTSKENDFPDPDSPIKRLVIRTEATDIPDGSKNDFKGKTIIVTMDNHGFADEIIEIIKAKKGKVITIGTGDNVDFKFDLTDIKNAEKHISEFRENHASIQGFIHLAPLDFYFNNTKSEKNDDMTDDRELNASVKTAFVIVKGLFDLLSKPGSIIGALSFDSVVFPYMEKCGAIHPSFAGLAGLLKTVNKEMPDTLVKIVDFSFKDIDGKKTGKQAAENIDAELADTAQTIQTADTRKTAEIFINELLSNDPRTEVGYRNNTRYILYMRPSISRRQDNIVKPGSTMLVTGGAGGITYEIIKKVAEKYKTNLIILDINDIFGLDEKFLSDDIKLPRIMAMLKNDMPHAKPVEIKRSADRIMRIRQSVENINYLKSLGVNVDYNVVDVTDFIAVKKTVDKYEKIDGIFHAAGMEMSQFIPKKELAAYELVVDVKVKGMVNLLQAMEEKDYDYFITFSSVTARFGNEGQSDYTAANDFLCKSLFRQKQLHPQRDYKIYAWTAWSGVGMATNPTVKKVLEERGIQFLPMDQGVKFFMADLLDSHENEMVFSGMDYSFDRDGLLRHVNDTEFPFLDHITARDENNVTFSRTLDLKRDLFLFDHSMDGTPVFLGSTGIETLAEAAVAIAGKNHHLVELNNFSIPYGIKILKQRPKELTIKASSPEPGMYKCEISSLFRNPKGIVMGDPTLHYDGMLKFAESLPENKKIKLPEFNKVELMGQHEDIVYNPKRLFMFGLFNTIVKIDSFDEKTLVTTVKDSSDREFFAGVTQPDLQTPAVIIDAMFQTGGLFEFFTTNRTVLPFKIKTLKFYKKPEKNREFYCITEKTASEEETNTYQLMLTDKKGNVYISIKDFQMVKLNKLDEKDRIDHKIKYK